MNKKISWIFADPELFKIFSIDTEIEILILTHP